MALVVKLHPDDLPKKAELVDGKIFKKKIYDIEDKDVKFLGDKPAVIDFFGEWCGPCKVLSPVFDKLSDKYKDKIDFYKVDIDKELDIAVAFNVMSVPNLLFIPMKSEAKLLPGAPSESQLEELINEYLINED